MLLSRATIWILWSVWLPAALGADVVTTTYVPDSEKGNPNPKSKTEVIQVVFEPGEEATAQAVLQNTINEAYKSNSKATVDVICAVGGAMSSAECGGVRKKLSKHEDRPQYSFEEAKGEFPEPRSGVSDKGGNGNPPLALRGTEGALPPNLPSPPVSAGDRPARQPSDWKGVLTLIRTVSSGVIVGVTASISKGANWGQALIVGGTAGAWSGLMQWRNRDRLNWQAHRDWLTVTPPEPHEQAGVIKRYFKRAIQTGLYAALLSTAFYVSGLNPDLVTPDSALRLATTVGESLYTQTAWEALNQEWTEAAIRRNPEKAYLYKRLSGLASLLQAAINVTSNTLNIGGVHIAGVHLGTVISGTVGTIGTLTYAWRWLPEAVRHPITAVAGTVGSGITGTCSAIMNLFGRSTPPVAP